MPFRPNCSRPPSTSERRTFKPGNLCAGHLVMSFGIGFLGLPLKSLSNCADCAKEAIHGASLRDAMAFPLAHPAAVLPLRRYCPRGFNFAALVVGSLSPDAGYLFGQRNVDEFSHRVVGSFGFCLPV